MPTIYKIYRGNNEDAFFGTAQDIADRLGVTRTAILSASGSNGRVSGKWNIENLGIYAYVRNCKYCGKEFENVSDIAIFCSTSCGKKYRRRKAAGKIIMKPKSMLEIMMAASESGTDYATIQKEETIQRLRASGFWRKSNGA